MVSPGLRARPYQERMDEQREAPRHLSLSRDDAFHLLQNGRRRAVLRYMLEHEDMEEFRLEDIAETIAAWDQGTTARNLEPDHRQRVYVALYQSHLPKLDDHDVIDYDSTRRTITLRRLAYVLAPFLGDGLYSTQTIPVDGSESSETSTVDELLSKLGLASW